MKYQTIAIFALLLTATLASGKKPNVLLFFIDDLGYTDIGANGSQFYQTPNIDKLVKAGANFTNAYSAHPVCSPTRAALMSGKVPQRVGITQWISGGTGIHLPPAEVTIGEAMQQGGYSTGYIGKWHLGEEDEYQPDKQGFDWVRGTNRAGQPASYFYPYSRKKKNGAADVPDLEDGEKDDYLTDALTAKAIEFVDAQKEKPFFLCFSHYAVHTPVQAPEPIVKKYQYAVQKTYGKSATPKLQERNGSTTRGRQDNAAFAGMVESLDTNVGRLIDHLESKGKLDNTLIIFTSDNGGLSTLTRGPGATCNLPLRAGKGWNYEGGIRTPTFFYWKGKIQPRSIDTPAITTDLYPTILEFAGLPLKPEQHLDGISLKGLIKTGAPSETLKTRHIGWHYPHDHGSGHKPSNAIRKGDWKLIRFEDGKRFELYNIKADPGESKDQADTMPDEVKKLNALLDEWLKETGAN